MGCRGPIDNALTFHIIGRGLDTHYWKLYFRFVLVLLFLLCWVNLQLILTAISITDGKTIRIYGGEKFSTQIFFRQHFLCLVTFFGPVHEYFKGYLIGMHEFFSFNFPLHNTFCTSPTPP